MRDVYANSAFSISAIVSNDSDDGLFRSREAHEIPPGVLRRRGEGLEPQNYYICDNEYWNREVGNAELNRRG